MRHVFRAALTTAALIGLSVVTGPAVHAAPDSSDSASIMVDCGYNDDVNGYAVYNHCGPTTIIIEVDPTYFANFHMCVRPGNYVLGYSWLYSNAWYVGGVNCVPA